MILKSQNSQRKINRRYLAPPFLSQIVTRLRGFRVQHNRAGALRQLAGCVEDLLCFPTRLVEVTFPWNPGRSRTREYL